MYSPTRRTFLRRAACAALGASGVLSTIGDLRKLSAATTMLSSDYKALVCLFLHGGNDGNNVIVPRDTNGYSSYAAARENIALPQSSLLPLILQNGDGRDFGFHPNLLELQNLFNQQKIAVVANVGTLVAPVTREQYLNGGAAVPPKLFSHTDQSVQWQTSVPDQEIRTGWGGRMADLLQSLNNQSNVSLAISFAGTNTFEVGNSVHPLRIKPTGAVGLASNDIRNADVCLQAFKNLLVQPHTNVFEQTYTDIMTRSMVAYDVLTPALANAPTLMTAFPTSGLGAQLKMVAKLISVRAALNMQRQIFFCSIAGYDTHRSQIGSQAGLLRELSEALNAFYVATVELGIERQVTTFTASDFGRTLSTNGSGSDHGWGNHQFVMGGAVRGGRLYGTFPTITIDGPDDTGQGRWIPTTSVDEFSATMASWFGVAASDLPTVFPNIGRFGNPNLGFLG
jgi:uncharacterized protein (DUF1501 family)